jgi:hypothetical protein
MLEFNWTQEKDYKRGLQSESRWWDYQIEKYVGNVHVRIWKSEQVRWYVSLMEGMDEEINH